MPRRRRSALREEGDEILDEWTILRRSDACPTWMPAKATPGEKAPPVGKACHFPEEEDFDEDWTLVEVDDLLRSFLGGGPEVAASVQQLGENTSGGGADACILKRKRRPPGTSPQKLKGGGGASAGGGRARSSSRRPPKEPEAEAEPIGAESMEGAPMEKTVGDRKQNLQEKDNDESCADVPDETEQVMTSMMVMMMMAKIRQQRGVFVK